ncbi:MAG: ribosome maturation factor RimM [Anaerolineales bacterium]
MTEYLTIGRILRPHGVRGELVVEAEPRYAGLLTEAETVYLGEEAAAHQLTGARWNRNRLLIHLAGCDDRDLAEQYRGQVLRIELTEAPSLPPGTYYWNQILGLSVFTDAGEPLGVITNILETGANDVYIVTDAAGKELLIPAAPGVVQHIDIDAKQMTVRLPEGLR